MIDFIKKIDALGIGFFLLVIAVNVFMYSTNYMQLGKALFAVSLFFLFLAFLKKIRNMQRNRMLTWYAVFFCWEWITTFYSSHPKESMDTITLVATMQVPVIWSVVAYCTDQERIKMLMKVYLLTGVVLCFFVMIGGPGPGMRYGWYVAGQQPNTPALNLAAAFAFSMFLFFYENKKNDRRINLLLVLFFSLVIFLTGSRKIVIYMIGIVCGLLFYRSKNIKRTIGYVFLISVLMLVGYILLTQNQFLYEAMGQRIFTDMSDEVSAVERSMLRSEGFKYFLQSPIFGNGVDSFKWVCFAGVYSHNNFIEIANGTGLIGLFIYYSYLIFIAVKLWQGRGNKYNFLFFLVLIMTFAIEYYNVNYLQRGVFVAYTLAYCQYRIGCCKNESIVLWENKNVE